MAKITSFSRETSHFGRVAPTGAAAEQRIEADGMGWKVRKTIVLVGMMGAGKTAVGKALAARLGVPFLDSDTELQTAANMTIAEIFERYGEAFFREKESEVLRRLLEDPRKGVLSTGGGAFLSPANRAMITEKGISICLDADLELLWARVRHKSTRPLLRTADPRRTLGELYEIRAPIYALADLSVSASPDYSIEEMTEKVLAALADRPDVLERIR